MIMNMEVTLTLAEIEQAVHEYVAKNLSAYTVEGKLTWIVNAGYEDRMSYTAPSLSSVKFKVTTK